MRNKPTTITLSQALEKASVSPKVFSDLTGISLPGIYRLLDKNEIKSQRLGNRILIPTSVLRDIAGSEK